MITWKAQQNDALFLWTEKKISHHEKITKIWAMQKYHEQVSWEIVDTVFSLNPGIRDELVHESQKYPVTMLDFADIPQSISDQHILRLVASMLDKNHYEEKKINPERTNTFLLRDTENEVVVSPELLRIIERKLKNAIDTFLRAKLLRQEHIEDMKKYFTTDDQDNIIFKDQSQLLWFLRKTQIKNASLSVWKYKKTKMILIICSLLKQMMRHHDFKWQKKNIHQVRELLEKYVRWDLLSMLDWESQSPDINPIRDISHVDYFNDKIFIFRRDLLEKYGISYPKDIRTKITYRAKQDESIQDKLLIEPTAKTASMLHDLWWLKYVVLGENQKEERIILLYIMFLKYAEREQKYNPNINQISPANDDNLWFLPWGKYSKNDAAIIDFLNEMTVKWTYDDSAPLFKDKGIMPILKWEGEGKWILDYELLEKLHISDRRFIHLLEKWLEKKHSDYKKKKEITAKSLDIIKKNIFTQYVLKNVVWTEEWKEEIWWNLIKKYKDFEKKCLKIKVWMPHTIPDQTALYGYGINNDNKIYIYSTQDRQQQYLWDTCKTLYVEFIKKWNEYDSVHNQNPHRTDHKWSWQDGKIASHVRVWYKEYEKLPIETQVLWEKEIKNLPLIDDHVIFNPAKKLLVYWRNNSWILSLHDIYDIVDKNVLHILDSYPDKYCENGKTFKELSDAILHDASLAPAYGTVRDKIVYNFIHNRGLKKAGNVYLTKYYYNLKNHWLVPDGIE